MPSPSPNKSDSIFSFQSGQEVGRGRFTDLIFKIQWMHYFWFSRDSEHDGNSDALPSPLYTELTPTTKTKQKTKKIKYPINPNGRCALPTPSLKTLTVSWALSEQLLHVSTDPWRWCDKSHNLNFPCISKSLRSRVEMALFTLVFTCSSEAGSLKLQPKNHVLCG